MCLYIITQQTGAALHRALGCGGKERAFVITFHVSIRGRAHAHAANGTLRTQFFFSFFF